MGASEIMTLVAKLEPRGLSETVDGLEETEEAFENTAETAGDASEDLEAFSSRFEGAIGVAVGALAIGATGLLSTVPVIGEAFSGLFAIVEALGLQLDSLLRKIGAGGVTTALFEVADAVASADGALGDFVGLITGIGASISIFLGALFAAIPVINAVTGASLTFTGVLATIAGAIGTAIGAILSIPGALAIAAAAIIGFAAAYITNFAGVRDKTNAIVGAIVSTLTNLADIVLTQLSIAFETLFDLLVNIIAQGGNGIISAFESIINTAASGVTNGLNGILQSVEDTVNKSINALNQLPGVNLGGVSLGAIGGPGEISLGRLQTTSNREILARGAQRQTQAFRQNELGNQLLTVIEDLANSQRGDTVLNIDGREVAREVEPFIGRSTGDRGR